MMSLIVFVGLGLVVVVSSQGITVPTSQGNVVGSTASDGSYYVFYGIPYAGDTSGANRFKAPPPAPRFPGDFHAIDSSRVCAQPTSSGLVGVEDCLVLSIFTRNITTPQPVIVWIDGQEYTNTDTRHRFSYKGLVEEGNVVVALNYRLSIFGFLCLGVTDAPGNAGLKDVIAGLKWIQENIAGFGGNPNNVTLFGHGSGAAIVDLVTLSPLGRNLTHKAILSSGSALAPWAVAYDPIGSARAVGDILQYSGKSREELATALASTDVNVLANALNRFNLYNNTALFAPCIEDSKLNPNDTFLAEAPLSIIRSGNYSHIPYIIGYATREGTIRVNEGVYGQWMAIMNSNFSEFLQADLTFPSLQNRTSTAQTIKEYYFGANSINMGTIESYFDFHGDTMFVVSIIRGAWERALTSSAPVRLYEFGHRGTQNSDWGFIFPLTGAKHGSILNYLFDFDLTAADSSARNTLIKRWSAFAATGSPMPSGAAPTAFTDWPPVTSDIYYYYILTGETQSPGISLTGESFGTNPHQIRMQFWNEMYRRHYVAPRSVSSSEKVLSFVSFVFICQIIVSLLSF